MRKQIYHMAFEQAIRDCTVAELTSLMKNTHPAFLAAVVKAKKSLMDMGVSQ